MDFEGDTEINPDKTARVPPRGHQDESDEDAEFDHWRTVAEAAGLAPKLSLDDQARRRRMAMRGPARFQPTTEDPEAGAEGSAWSRWEEGRGTATSCLGPDQGAAERGGRRGRGFGGRDQPESMPRPPPRAWPQQAARSERHHPAAAAAEELQERRRRVCAPRWQGGRQGVRFGGDVVVGRTLVVGSSGPRTRTSIAQNEVHQVLGRLRLLDLAEEFLPAGPTSKVVRVRLHSWEAVTQAIGQIRDAGVTSTNSVQPLWAARARTAAETARIGPITRGVRSLKMALESELQAAGRQPLLSVEGA